MGYEEYDEMREEKKRVQSFLELERTELTKEERSHIRSVLKAINGNTPDLDNDFMYAPGKRLGDYTEEECNAVISAVHSTDTDLQQMASTCVIRGCVEKMLKNFNEFKQKESFNTNMDKMEYVQQCCLRVIARLPFYDRSYRTSLSTFVLNEIDYECLDQRYRDKAAARGVHSNQLKSIYSVNKAIAALEEEDAVIDAASLREYAEKNDLNMSQFTDRNIFYAVCGPREKVSLDGFVSGEEEDDRTIEDVLASDFMRPDMVLDDEDGMERIYETVNTFPMKNRLLAYRAMELIDQGVKDWRNVLVAEYVKENDVTYKNAKKEVETTVHMMQLTLPQGDEDIFGGLVIEEIHIDELERQVMSDVHRHLTQFTSLDDQFTNIYIYDMVSDYL